MKQINYTLEQAAEEVAKLGRPDLAVTLRKLKEQQEQGGLPGRMWYASDMINIDPEKKVELSGLLTEKVRPMFFGKHPAVQMLSLMDLVSIWVSGHDQAMQQEMLDSFHEGVRELVAVINKRKVLP